MSIQAIDNLHYCSFVQIGKSGAGKSTFLNSLIDSNEFKTSSSGNSCTQEIKVHQVPIDDVMLILTDAPGLFDSKGIVQEQKNLKGLADFFRGFQYGLNGIAIVITSSDCRLDTVTKKIIKLLYQFIGNDNLWSHLCVIVTHCPQYQEDVLILQQSMTSGEDSLKKSIQKLIKGISNLKEEPQIPFFFVDSKHPTNSPSRETLPIFKKWLFELSSIKTNNVKDPDVNYQFKEKRNRTETFPGNMCPIYKMVRGETKKITVKETVPVIVKKTGVRKEKREVEYWETREWDAVDIWLLGIARAFRKNKVRHTRWEDYDVTYQYDEVEYRDNYKVIESPGDLQKVLRGYYQEIKNVTTSWTAYWDYEVDVIDKSNPTYESDHEVISETTIDYFDDKQSKLSMDNYSQLINELKELI